jgi:hypothetical protein
MKKVYRTNPQIRVNTGNKEKPKEIDSDRNASIRLIYPKNLLKPGLNNPINDNNKAIGQERNKGSTRSLSPKKGLNSGANGLGSVVKRVDNGTNEDSRTIGTPIDTIKLNRYQVESMDICAKLYELHLRAISESGDSIKDYVDSVNRTDNTYGQMFFRAIGRGLHIHPPFEFLLWLCDYWKVGLSDLLECRDVNTLLRISESNRRKG